MNPKVNKLILIMIYCLLLVSVIYFGISSVYYQEMYKEAVKHGSEMFVTCLEMNVACQTVGNVTIQEVEAEWMRTFLSGGIGE